MIPYMKCPHCDTAIPGDSVFCPSCGADVANNMQDQIETFCRKCGTRFKGYVCPNCGESITTGASQPNTGGGRKCPFCGSQNISYQNVQVGNVGVSTNRVVIQAPKKSHGCLYWLLIGWWFKPMYWMMIGWWWGLLFGGRSRGGLNYHASKNINRTMAVCQNCGHNWKV